MQDRRIQLAASLFLAVGLSAGVATAQNIYSLTGRTVGQNTASWLLPAGGSGDCSDFIWKTAVGTMTPAPNAATMLTSRYLAQAGCVPGAGTLSTANSSLDMVGERFTVPTSFFNLPAPGTVFVFPIPTAASLAQLATSWNFIGPMAYTQLLTPIMATMQNGTNTAPWGVFKASAWTGHTGRAGATFTWCPGTMAMGITGCPSPAAGGGGLRPLIIKNVGGTGNPGGFGGTMGLTWLAGANAGNFAQARPLGGAVHSMSVALGVLDPCGVGNPRCIDYSESDPFGRGYAAYLNHTAAVGDLYSMYKLTTMNPPSQALIGMVSGAHLGTGPAATQTSAIFPWTTGQVVVRQTGMTPQGMVNVRTISGNGFDTTTTMGARNIHLVSGKLATTVVGGALTFNWAALGHMEYQVLPEPGGALSLFTGTIGLLAVSRHRRARPSQG